MSAYLLLHYFPEVLTLLADRGYESNKIRELFLKRNITPCILPRKNRKQTLHYNKEAYKKRHKVENMFARLKEWRRVNITV